MHLVSSVQVAVALGRPWAFTDRHADLAHALHFDDLQDLHAVPWDVMNLSYWAEVKEERQAEFLVHRFFPWTAVKGIAVMTRAIAAHVRHITENTAHRPPITVEPSMVLLTTRNDGDRTRQRKPAGSRRGCPRLARSPRWTAATPLRMSA